MEVGEPVATVGSSAAGSSRRVRIINRMQPRDPLEGARVVFTLTAVASVVTMVSALLGVDRAGGAISVSITVTVLALLLIASWLLRYGDHRRTLPWAVFPFVGLTVVVALDLMTRDASTAAQIFLLFPALYASSQTPPTRGDRRHPERDRRRGGHRRVRAAGSVMPLWMPSTWPRAIGTTSVLLTLAAERRELVIGRLRRHAAVDPLTGLVTRRVLESAAQTALTGATQPGRYRARAHRRRPLQGGERCLRPPGR